MNEPLLTFQRFTDIGLATEFADKLTQWGIYCEIDNQTAPFDVSYANNPLELDIRLKIGQGDFDKANAALDDYYKGQLDTVDADYYLLQFTDEELMDIVKKPDEWNRLDYQLAQKLLKEHGREVQPEVAKALEAERLAALSKAEKTPAYWIAVGYLAPLFGFAMWLSIKVLFYAIPCALTGVVLGALLVYSKKTLPDGRRVYLYVQSQRSHGRFILAISLASFAFYYVGIMAGWFF